MREIPFYSNRKDNNSCMLACFKSAFEYLTGEPYSWEKLEKLTGYKADKAAWTVKIWTEMSDTFDIRMIEGFDYQRYFDTGEPYLHTFLKPEEVEWQLRESNIAEIRPLIPEFLKKVRHEKRSPTISDIEEMLHDGYLVFAQLNQKTLNNESGYVAHMVLVFDDLDDDFIFHDPGLPAFQNRRAKKTLIHKAIGGNNSTAEITGIKLKHGK